MSLFWSMVIGAAGAIALGELVSISLNVSAMKSTLEEIRDHLQVIEANSRSNDDTDDDIIDDIIESRLKQRSANGPRT